MAEGMRGQSRAQWRALFKSFDAVICPVMPTPAYPHDHSPEQETRRINIDGKDYAYPDRMACPGIATLPGLPATAIPIGLSPQGLPIGVQIVGPWLEDRTPLKLAELIERELVALSPRRRLMIEFQTAARWKRKSINAVIASEAKQSMGPRSESEKWI